MSEKSESDHFKGWLWKWTNYIKGYQRRWFVLSNGLLSYYRSQAEMAHTCRGTINLAGAFIVTEDSCNFMISNGGAQTFHLKASSEIERQRWITALELAKAKASRMMENDESSDEDGGMVIVDTPPNGDLVNQVNQSVDSDLRSTLRLLASKLDDLATCNDLISKHGGTLQRSLAELETQGKKWHKAIIHEREHRLRLEETVETLAKQHNTLERAIHAGTGPPRSDSKIDEKENDNNVSEDEDDDDEFVDASDKGFTTEFVKTHKKSESTASTTSSISVDVSSVKDEVAAIARKQSSVKIRRTQIPDKPNYSLNLWSIMKNCIGRDLSKIPMPVNFNEPLSMLQRLGEDVEYAAILDRAAKCTSSQEQMAHVVAFSCSNYATTLYRTGKPFNPLLGETFECDRREDLGFRILCEQVSHHPPAAAMHVESKDYGPNSGWTYWQEISLSSKFRGKYLNVCPLGVVHLKFHASGNYYTWRKVTTTVHNIIVGKLWVDQSGEAEVINHTTGDRCKHKYFPYSYFSRDTPRKVSGVVVDKNDKAYYVMSGTWDSHMDAAQVDSVNYSNRSKPAYKTLPAKRLWQKYPLPIGSEKMYFFSTLAVTLNEEEPGIAPTDSRLRPDQRMMEKADWDLANELKQGLEDSQRARRRKREAEAIAKKAAGQQVELYKPIWFSSKKCEITGEIFNVYQNEYWECKEKADWSRCPSIFEVQKAPILQSVTAAES
ncbi:unnamed protein product [Clavelina lepadiformis]|uniref:Oxysterol-binding protein n=1 Tax=Clavelina lepadiformis TaxID=159417 RepID=A0ABP0GRX6_CLALP